MIEVNFNPRSHKGSDGGDCDGINSQTISIHAPTRGATQIITVQISVTSFQSTLPQGERPYGYPLSRIFELFQSTLPQGERPKYIDLNQKNGDFNPRSHKGSDFFRYSGLLPFLIFQSTLPQGERQQYLTKKIFLSSEIL